MSEINKTYRIRTDIGDKLHNNYISIDANLLQDYDTFDILSVKINSVDTYQLHNSNYGVVVGRVLANNGFGVPNAKLSIFIESDSEDGEKIRNLYPFTSVVSRDSNNIRYNLLPNEKINDCHSVVGTFPNKRYALDNDAVLEVFDKYYKYTTRTNHAGDYLLMGIPVGTHTIHMDLDLSDCGILSQRPRDFVYKGYTIEQFENPNMFKTGTEYENLSQIFSQNQVVNVQPFWGNSTLGEKIGITRTDINISFKFEPTCVFMGSVISDNSSHGISKKCRPTDDMGLMEELVTGSGTIEMIRKTPSGSIEEFQVKGTQLINGDGIWCYQIPMNLDYMMTDEYGNMVPTDNPDIGIPTRTRVRFRISMQDNEKNVDNYFRAKVLVPHNPQVLDGTNYEEYDYEFGSLTRDESFRDLFWNNVYSVKSYFPRFQKRRIMGWKDKKFTGIKGCNFHGSNNPFPYNNMRIKLRFMFVLMCILVKIFIFLVSIINTVISMIGNALANIGNTRIWIFKYIYLFPGIYGKANRLTLTVLSEGLCPDLENWFFAPMIRRNFEYHSPPNGYRAYDIMYQTLQTLKDDEGAYEDKESIDKQNDDEAGAEETICLTTYTDYLISCIEMNLAMEYKVINFDFYNDWVNGTIYFPRFMRYVRPKQTFLGFITIKSKIKSCMDDTSIFSKTRRYAQQCSIGYLPKTVGNKVVYTKVNNPLGNKKDLVGLNNFHKGKGFDYKTIFGDKGGICHEHSTLKGQHVYYMKPCEWHGSDRRKATLFANDIILLGSLNDCDIHGIPQAFKYLSSTSYIMPTNLALTNMETDGPLYTNKGTICSGKNSVPNSNEAKNSKVTVLPPSCGITAELLAYENAQSTLFDIQYDGAELSDVIALTEAAGISWNYTGPGQGTPDQSKLYYPGGHFLGLSCIRSQTNIKSCINLSRICEVGANMSQRYEDISNIKNSDITYTYTVPSGFISGNDIVGAEFRSMFATMNHKPLIATKTNPLTGYKMYDMEFVKPTGFNGAFQTMIDGGAPYNTNIEVAVPDKDVLTRLGIAYGASDDHDENEYINTQTRTIEDTSLDYYRFRFGLDMNDLTKSSSKHKRKFLGGDNSRRILPQYENSYYFYFGLKNGATAIEEFNKQFFSDCGNSKLISDEPTVEIGVMGDLNMCKACADITVTTNNLEVPYQFIEIVSDVEFVEAYNEDGSIKRDEKTGEIIKSKNLLVINSDEVTKYDEWLNSYSFVMSACPFGTYRFAIRDANDVLYTKVQGIGLDVLSFESEIFDFNYRIDTDRSIGGKAIHKGGYISVSNVHLNELPDVENDGEEKAIKYHIYLKKNNDTRNDNEISTSSGKNGDNKTHILSVNETGRYELWIRYDCDNDESDKTHEEVKMLMTSFDIKDTSSLGLTIGVSGLSAKTMNTKTHPYGWWSKNTMSGNTAWLERAATFNSVSERDKNAATIGLFAHGGNRVVWGHAQNSISGITTDVYCSEIDDDIKPGYVLDDSYVHYPTYKYNGKEMSPFSTLVYNGTMVMGDYTAYLDSGVIKGGKDGFYSGCGYIFKTIPYGDLQFHVYDGKNLKYNEKTEDGEDVTDGVFYPSIAYHSIDRGFKVNTNFFCWSKRGVEMETNESGEESLNITSKELGCKTEITIHNGITYDGKFNKGSNATGFPEEYIFSAGSISDVYGLKGTTVEPLGDRKLTYQHFYNGAYSAATSGIDTYSYSIIEGAPILTKPTEVPDTYEEIDGSDFVNTISDSVDSKFADYITYTLSGNTIVSFSPVGGYDSSAKYYLAKSGKGGGKKLFKRNGIINLKMGGGTYYVLCSYTKKAKYNNEGAPVIANFRIITNKFLSFNYKIKNENDENVTYSNTLNVQLDGNDPIARIKYVIENYCPHIEYVENNELNESAYYDMWGEILEKNKLNIVSAIDNDFNSSDIYYAFGVLENEETNTKLYKIYPNIVKTSTFNEPEVDISVEVSGNVETINFKESEASSTTINLKVTKGFEWISSVSNGSDWIISSPSSGNGSGAFESITIKVKENMYNDERNGVITYKINDEIDETSTDEAKKYKKQINIEQPKGDIKFVLDKSSVELSTSDSATVSAYVTITSGRYWKAKSTNDSIEIKPSSGDGSGNVTIKVPANKGTTNKEYKIVFTAVDSGGKSLGFNDITLTIKQPRLEQES